MKVSFDNKPRVTSIVRVPGEDRDKLREEMDAYYLEMEDFRHYPPEDIFMCLAAWTARISHVRTLTCRVDSNAWKAFRSNELDPFISECERQFRNYSRAFSVSAFEGGLAR